MLVSFQSTGATNISGVNNLPSANLYVTIKSLGKTPNHCYWGIEQNEARATYLGHYYGVDNVNHMIKNATIRYTTWKYWHAPFLHALSMAVLAAYNMYAECCEGGAQRGVVHHGERLLELQRFLAQAVATNVDVRPMPADVSRQQEFQNCHKTWWEAEDGQGWHSIGRGRRAG
jgi:hypothetical protein